MEPITSLLTTATRYILRAAAESKTAQDAQEALLSKFWSWAKKFFINEAPQMEAQPLNPETVIRTQERLQELLKNQLFMDELALRLEILEQLGVTEKNVVKQDIEDVKKISADNKVNNPDEQYGQKNVVNGSVRNTNEFTLGDGH